MPTKNERVKAQAKEYLQHLSNLIFSLFGCEPIEQRLSIIKYAREIYEHDNFWVADYQMFRGQHDISVPPQFMPEHDIQTGPTIMYGLKFRALDEDCMYFKTISPTLQLLWRNDLVDFMQRRSCAQAALYGDGYNSLWIYWANRQDGQILKSLFSYKKFEHFVLSSGDDLDVAVLSGFNPVKDKAFNRLSPIEQCSVLEWVYLRQNSCLNAYILLAKAYQQLEMRTTAELVILRGYTSWSMDGGTKRLDLLEKIFPDITLPFAHKNGRPRVKSNSPLDASIDYITKQILAQYR